MELRKFNATAIRPVFAIVLQFANYQACLWQRASEPRKKTPSKADFCAYQREVANWGLL
jgi:hypothetical protein